MPNATYKPLSTVTFGGSDTDIIFHNIPPIYKDLIIVLSGTIQASSNTGITFNSDSASGSYHSVFISASGNIDPPSTGIGSGKIFMHLNGGNRNTIVYQVMDYSATNKHKVVLARSSSGDSYVSATSVRWASNSPVTSLRVDSGTSTFLAGTVCSIYGIEG